MCLRSVISGIVVVWQGMHRSRFTLDRYCDTLLGSRLWMGVIWTCCPDCLMNSDVPTVFTAQSVRYRLLLRHTRKSCWEEIEWLKFEVQMFLRSAQALKKCDGSSDWWKLFRRRLVMMSGDTWRLIFFGGMIDDAQIKVANSSFCGKQCDSE